MVQHTLSMVHQYEKGVVYHSFFVLIRVWGNVEPLQDAREALVSARLVHLAPEAKRRDFMSSCPHHRECVMVSVDSSPLKHVVIRNRFWRFASDLLPKCYKIEKKRFWKPPWTCNALQVVRTEASLFFCKIAKCLLTNSPEGSIMSASITKEAPS